ncbi:arylesterase [Parapedobacter koreensis]|uniref:Acyl-CoA thioesterase-1 n=1 Tax=Parapedobacter koreensis TaxID=332977 RepID=A0A1H7NW78_9SPHI|nr:arylesterase [Parapedobacter koreensis]SEL27813.1 acyl-CoA thioesterase-1 [Parapedobacter koreensis]
MFFNRFFIPILGLFFAVACSNSPGGAEGGDSENQQQDTASALAETKTILFFGNSLTAGYGLEGQELAFPGLIQQRIDSLALPYRVINAGLSGETTAAGNERIDWLLNEKIDLFVLELGANDGLRGIPTEETHKNLQRIIDKVTAKYPDCKLVLTGMMVPPNMGGNYGSAFMAIFPALAKENDMAYVPFLLEGVAGESELNQRDGIHPTEEGHRILAENVWKVLLPLL